MVPDLSEELVRQHQEEFLVVEGAGVDELEDRALRFELPDLPDDVYDSDQEVLDLLTAAEFVVPEHLAEHQVLLLELVLRRDKLERSFRPAEEVVARELVQIRARLCVGYREFLELKFFTGSFGDRFGELLRVSCYPGIPPVLESVLQVIIGLRSSQVVVRIPRARDIVLEAVRLL